MKKINASQALELNSKLSVVINRPNPLGLSESGLPQGGQELSASVASSLHNIQAMAKRAIDAGRATPQALDMLAKTEAIFAEYGIK